MTDLALLACWILACYLMATATTSATARIHKLASMLSIDNRITHLCKRAAIVQCGCDGCCIGL